MRVLAIAIALVLAALVSSSVFVVRENELAVLFQFGRVVRTDVTPGIHFKLPWLQDVRTFDRRVLTLDSEAQPYLTSEKKDVLVDFFVKWRIKDVSRFYTASSGDPQIANQRLLPVVRQALGKEINERLLVEVVSGERSDVMAQIKETSEAAVADLGIQLVDVRVMRIDLPDAVSESVYRRMRAERQRVANELRSTGTERSEAIRADADRQRVVLLAEAERDSNRLRGEGEGEAAATYAKAYQLDPEFYSFYRSLEAYRVAMKGKDTTLVLDPKSEFFRYFEEGK